jgi:ABC-type uncharacterized transport system substrate-binding protein
MKRMLIIGVCLLPFLFSACAQGDKKTRIGFVQITEDEVLNTAKEGVFAALKESGFVDGQNIEPIYDTNLLVNTKACETQALVVPKSVLDKATSIAQ